MLDGSDETGPFGIQPCQRLRMVVEDRLGRFDADGGERQPQLFGVEQAGGGVDGVQIVVL